MRELKFRYWREEDKRMFQLDSRTYINHNGKIEDVWIAHEDAFEYNYPIMQFTGLKDRKEVDIYEGDIVKFHYFFGSLGSGLGFVESEHELTGIVEYGIFGWGVNKIKGEHWEGYTGYDGGEGDSSFMELTAFNESSIHEESFEVIGNIYENPELL